MELEMTMKSTIYIHKQPQNCSKFSRPFTGWIFLGCDIVADKLEEIAKTVCRTACKGSNKITSLIKRTQFWLWFQFWYVNVIKATAITSVTQCFSVTPEQDRPEHLKKISVKNRDQSLQLKANRQGKRITSLKFVQHSFISFA